MEYSQREILKILGENSAYSAKGHFKSADVRRILTYLIMFVNISFAALSLTDLLPNFWLKVLSISSLIASIILLMFETKGGLTTCDKQMSFGNKYMELHNDIMTEFFNDNISDEKIERLKDRLNKLNNTERPTITTIAKWWAKYAIEASGETKIWWR